MRTSTALILGAVALGLGGVAVVVVKTMSAAAKAKQDSEFRSDLIKTGQAGVSALFDWWTT